METGRIFHSVKVQFSVSDPNFYTHFGIHKGKLMLRINSEGSRKEMDEYEDERVHDETGGNDDEKESTLISILGLAMLPKMIPLGVGK